MSAPDVAAPRAEGIDPRVWKVAAVAIIGPFMTQMDSTVVNLSLSTIRLDLQASIATSQWIVGGYLLALALMLPLNGWLVDRIGAKRLYLACFSAFTLASLLCGASRTMDQLIAARVVQGMAGGLLAPMTQMMIAKVAGRQMARVMGYTVMPILIAPVLGPVLAGTILKYATWHWLFYINLPVGLLGLVLAMILLPNDRDSLQRRPIDLLGLLLISPGLVCLLYGFQHVSNGDGATALLAGVLLMGGFIWHAARKGGAALIDIQLFHNRVFSTAAVTQFFSIASFYARQFLIPLYLVTGCALSASQAGSMLAAMGVGMMCSYPFIGFLTEHFGCRHVSAGGALLALASMLPFFWMIFTQFSPVLATASLFLAGAGHGMINIPSLSAAYASVSSGQLAVANTTINIVQRLGGPLATTSIAVVMPVTASYWPGAGPHAFMLAFALLIALHLLSLASASRLPKLIHGQSGQ